MVGKTLLLISALLSFTPENEAITVNNGPGLHIDDGGRGGIPVVFMHAFAGSSAQWRAQLEHLRKTRRAIAFDFRGHGKSAAPSDGDYSVKAFAQDLAAVVDSLELDRFVLVGHSLGGSAAAEYAGEHPERVAGIVLVAAPGKAPAEQAQQIIGAMEQDYEKTSEQFWTRLLGNAKPEVQARIRSDMKNMQREPALKIIRAVFEHDPLPALKRYNGPKLSIAVGPRDMPTDLHMLLPGLAYERFTDTSHWPHMDRPADFNRILDAFLQRL